MWIMTTTGFVSLVHKDCHADELLVRARRPRDIQRLLTGARVTKNTSADYLYRTTAKRVDLALALANVVDDINYGNFKSAVADERLHDAYFQVWAALARLQRPAPYSGSKWFLPE